MIKTTHKGWRVLFNGDEAIYPLVNDIVDKNMRGYAFKEIKNNSRSHVLLIDFQGKKAVLKSPREKNTRKWIRFTTLYRRGEAFKVLQNMEKLEQLGIETNKPLMAMERRWLGMVVDSWLLYEFKAGKPCHESDYPAIVRKLKAFHDRNLLHGDPNVKNFLTNGDDIITIDANPKKPVFGSISKYYEYFYLRQSAPGIEKYFDLPENDMSYRIAKLYSRIYWSWRGFKKISRQKKKEKMTILVIRLSSIGDIILTTPILDAIKKKYPDAVIHFLVMDRFKDAISGNPNIDELILFEKEKYKGLSGIARFAQSIKHHRYDLIVDLHAKIRSILISLMVGGRVLRYKKRSFWKSILVPLRLTRYHVDDTIVRNYFKPLEKIHVYFTKESLTFTYDEKDLQKVASHQNCIVMAPGAANNTKRWPAENFARLGQMLDEPIALIGDSDDISLCDDIRRKIGDRCENLAGKLSLKESGALIAASKYVITNDSSPFHIARGVGTKAFVLFGPTDPGMFEYDENAVLIHGESSCAPCSLHGDDTCVKGHFDCMTSLTPEFVYEIIKKEIHKTAT